MKSSSGRNRWAAPSSPSTQEAGSESAGRGSLRRPAPLRLPRVQSLERNRHRNHRGASSPRASPSRRGTEGPWGPRRCAQLSPLSEPNTAGARACAHLEGAPAAWQRGCAQAGLRRTLSPPPPLSPPTPPTRLACPPGMRTNPGPGAESPRPGAREPHLWLPARAPRRPGQLSPESRRLRLKKQKGGGGRYGGGVVWRPPPSVTHSPETPMGGGRERCKRRREEPALLRTPCGVRP